ncbi:sensor histidine kinase [Nocardia anaemiae]|uniref:sensor histidine kinase n=1 Tax=Nocardia anaemiae TaxID=263910 RepID=UPI000A89685A|nr:sensor histidine kinase [Nocardia anaemiae]
MKSVLRGGVAAELLDRVVRDGGIGANVKRRGWFGGFMSVIWLSYMVGPIIQSWQDADQPTASLATAALLVYAALIVGSFIVFQRTNRPSPLIELPVDRRIWPVLAGMTACSAGLVALLGAIGLPTLIFIGVIAIFHMPSRESGYVAFTVTLAMLLVPVLLPGLSGTPFYVSFVPALIWVARQLGLRGERLAELARRQQAELAIVEERNRVARDVHDILGHSLTVITVKTELAQRLIEVDLTRAKSELADVERLAREALAGVRDTVGGLREVSLGGELANARTALAAADIDADLPDSVPDTRHSELFGWVLREAVTNVIRHSAARHCTVTVTDTSIEVVDDGRGLGTGESGSGLSGLRERVRAAGGTLTLSSEGGVRIRATVPE